LTVDASPRAEHIGSLLRPPALLETAAAHAEQRITDDQLRTVEDRAILEALRLQQDVGLEVVSDGEFRRTWFAGAWMKAIQGFVDPQQPAGPGALGWHGTNPALATAVLTPIGGGLVVGDRVRQVHRFAEDECSFLRQHAPGPFKITLPGVVSQAMRWFRPGITDRFYPTRRSLIEELAGLLSSEVRLLSGEGAAYIQLDSLVYAIQLGDRDKRAELEAAGEDLDEILSDALFADNQSLEPARSAGVMTGLHMCRGNNRSQWVAQGGYEPVAERAFSELKVDRLLLEYDSDRAGGFEPLRFVSAEKTVVLGLVSTKTPQLESQADLLRRIEEASRYVPVERLALSPQCGFASVAPGNLISFDDQRRKLELVVDTAQKVWG
jgi:5-methyltetrahydropteroyltriglutamate--homocysteine methyltransferase